jgi:hypothetical protein
MRVRLSIWKQWTVHRAQVGFCSPKAHRSMRRRE